MSTVVLDGQRVIPERLLELGYDFKYHNLKPALEDLLGQFGGFNRR
jgi:NAD dependent epimerase/dehydratase family enzyme